MSFASSYASSFKTVWRAIGGFRKPLPMVLEVLSVDELFHFRLSRKAATVASRDSLSPVMDEWQNADGKPV